ncbi:MAG: DUF4430 domain-containing protein [Candidatus Thermoplasmatota archaeon]|nr:DUF4430 domain-containing protein [Candidatus Thermoplasmatota archaeon]
MSEILPIIFTALALTAFAGTIFQPKSRLKAISVIWLVTLIISTPIINSEWNRINNLLLDEEKSHYGLPKEWEDKQVMCIHFPDDYTSSEFNDGRHHISSTGETIFIDTYWNESGVCLGGFSEYSNGFDFLLNSTNILDNKLLVNYTESSFGPYVTSIGGFTPTGNSYWALYHNGAMSMVGIGDLELNSNSIILWQVDTW